MEPLPFEQKSKLELLRECEDLGIKNCKSKNKTELINLIRLKIEENDRNDRNITFTRQINKCERRGGIRSSSPTFNSLTVNNLNLHRELMNHIQRKNNIILDEDNEGDIYNCITNMSKYKKNKIWKNIKETEIIENDSITSDSLSVYTRSIATDSNPTFVERINVEYSDEELFFLEQSKNEFNSQYNKLTIKFHNNKKKSIIYENQKNTAISVNEKFKNRKILIQLIIGLTQSGKTGCMIETIKEYINNNNIPSDNIYIISGLSSIEWKNQCRQRFPQCIKIYHNNEMDKFRDDVKDKQNVLIILDEVHVATLKDQTINKIFNELNWNLDCMMKNDIKMIQFSATPDGIIFALNHSKWPKEHYSTEILNPGNGYYGTKEMKIKNKLRQNKDIYGRNKSGEWLLDENGNTIEREIYNNINEILMEAINNFGFNNPKYIIIRIRGKNKNIYEENIRNSIENTLDENLKELFNYDYIHEYTLSGNINDIGEFLHNPPNKFTFIFIKEKMKCAKTLEYFNGKEILPVKNNIGIVVERYANNANDSFIIQGLLGRLCGYEEHEAICFTNLESVEKYHQLFDSNFSKENLNNILWNSNSTKQNKKNKKTTHKKNINSIEELDKNVKEDNKVDETEPIIKEFKTKEEVKQYYISNLKEKLGSNRRGPNINKIKPNENGYYEANVRGNKKVYSYNEIIKERKCNINNGAGYKLYPCYKNTNEKLTLLWLLIYYEPLREMTNLDSENNLIYEETW